MQIGPRMRLIDQTGSDGVRHEAYRRQINGKFYVFQRVTAPDGYTRITAAGGLWDTYIHNLANGF